MDSAVNSNVLPLNPPGASYRSGAAGILSIHHYLPFAAFYFFLNHAGLPVGLFYTTLISPFLFVWLYLKGCRWLTTKFLLALSPFMLAHVLLGIPDPSDYLRTLLHWWTVYIVVYMMCWALRECWNLDRLFDELILLNFFAAILALIIRPTPLRPILWMDTGETIQGTPHLLRLNLFCHEPSAYAELMLPLLVFSVLRMLRDGRMRNASYLGMIALPFLLCQSFGGISIGLGAIGVAVLVGHRQFLKSQKSRTVFLCLAVATGLVILTPNTISQRVFQVITGGDGSTQGRTTFAFIAAFTVVSAKSLWWGVGLGQFKLTDLSDLQLGLYNGVPNQVAGIFAEFGIAGVLVELGVEFYLFFRTKAYRNSFRLAMFVVAFIQQFTGSYGTDMQEYLMWFLAFYPLLPEFDLRKVFSARTISSS
jgi:hypothetical protein